jgi:predicted RNA-binding Zn ribbon-like protein
MLESLESYSGEIMPRLCEWANSTAEVSKTMLPFGGQAEIKRWLVAMSWDAERKRFSVWDGMSRADRQDVLDELAECVMHVSISVADEREGGGAEDLIETCIRKFGFKNNSRLRRRIKKRARYVTEVIKYDRRQPGLVLAAIFVLWLLDRPDERKKLRRCADPRCKELFWSPGPTKHHKFCPGGGCKARFDSKKHYDSEKLKRSKK